MKQKTIIGLCILLLIPIAIACKESYTNKEDVVVFDIIETAGSGADCNISLYNYTSFISNRTMARDGNKYAYNYSRNLSTGIYRANIECKKGAIAYNSECAFVIEKEVDSEYYLYIVAFIIFFILMGIGYHLDDPTFIILSGFLSIIIAINLYVNGFPNLTNEFLRNGIIIVLIGIGACFIIMPSIKFIEEELK